MIYITVKTEYNKILQNKVAIRCDINKENIQEIAKKAFEDICTMDKIDQSEVCYNVFIKNKLDFYKLCATSDERQDKITNKNVLFITVKTKLDTVLQNKVALNCDIENENIEEIAEDCFEGISLILGFPKEQLCYEIFIKNNGIFYTLKNAKQMKKTKPEIYALVDKIHDNNWTPIFRWADSISRNFTGKFSTIDDVINDIPQNIKKIILQYVDDNGKEINKIIDRNVPC